MTFLVRSAVFALWLLAIWAASKVFGGSAGLVFALGSLTWASLVWVILPRTAHRGFRKGKFSRAAWTYRLLYWLRLDRRARAAIHVSVAACYLGQGNYRAGLARLERVDAKRLTESVQAAWLNNRAYARVRDGQDPQVALAESDQAIALRPDLSGFRHTHGVVLRAVGRTDEAIRELDRLWPKKSETPVPPMLESERCYDLALCWTDKGEREYAADYFERARRAAPDSIWAQRAATQIESPEVLPEAMAELV